MKLLDMYDGFSVVAIHYDELRLLVDAFDAIDPTNMTQSEHAMTLGSAFEAMMYAGRLQVKTGDLWTEATLRKFRHEQGIRDWQPDEVIYNREPLSLGNAAD